MPGRFSDLTKIPNEPVAKLLSQANVKLDTKLDAPASAMPEVVFEELESKGAFEDILKVMAFVLPAREATWWACLAARDVVGSGPDGETHALKAAEAWVFRPTAENREAAFDTIDVSDPGDPTLNCALAVTYSDGTSGPGDLAQVPGPPGGPAISVFCMVADAVSHISPDYDAALQVLIDRGIDIAKGGSGKLKGIEGEGA